MELFIGNLPPKISLAELLIFFRAFKGKADFRLEKGGPDGTLLYAVAELDSERYARKLVEKYQGAQVRGKKLVIREYVHRSYANERRAVNWREKPWRAGERRRNERRHKEAAVSNNDFDDILASSQQREQQEEERSGSLKVKAYRDLARKS
jgi:hypothetical protein